MKNPKKTTINTFDLKTIGDSLKHFNYVSAKSVGEKGMRPGADLAEFRFAACRLAMHLVRVQVSKTNVQAIRSELDELEQTNKIVED